MAADLAPGADQRGSRCRPAVTPTCPTSGSSPHPSAGWSSTSTTSTRHCPGPWEWDVKRLAASLDSPPATAASRRRSPEIVQTVGAHREAIRAFAGHERTSRSGTPSRDVEQVKGQVEDQLNRERRKRLDKGPGEGTDQGQPRGAGPVRHHDRRAYPVQGRTPRSVVPLARPVCGRLRAGEHPGRPLRPAERLHGLVAPRPPDLLELVLVPTSPARWSASATSAPALGWPAARPGRGRPAVLAGQEVGRSGARRPPPGAVAPVEPGARVVDGQRLMQTAGDIFLGWVRAEGFDGKQRDFYVRQLRDWKGSVEVEVMVPSALRVYAQICGWTLARSHARSGDRIALAGYLGSSTAFERALVRFARRLRRAEREGPSRPGRGHRRRPGGRAARRVINAARGPGGGHPPRMRPGRGGGRHPRAVGQPPSGSERTAT